MQSAPRSLLIRLALTAILVGIFTYMARHLFIDDALIYARYVRNALAGHGLVFNPGEHVNALTSPFYSYLVLGLARLLAGHVLASTLVVSSSFFLLACGLAEYLFPFSGLLAASTAYFYLMLGMETAVFLAMMLLVIFLVDRKLYNWLPTACLLLVLTRFEGGALVLVVLFELYRRKTWPRPASFIPASVLIALYLGLNRFWYGSILPASASAKLGQGRSGLWGRWPTAFLGCAYQLKPMFLPEVEVVAAVAVLAAIGMWLLRGTTWQRLLLPALAIIFAFYVLANIPGYLWYFAPFIFFAMVFACAAAARMPRWRWLPIPLIVFAAATSAFLLHRDNTKSNPSFNYPGIASWIDAHDPGATLEAAEIGTLGWDCADCHVIDIIGLTTPKNADHIAHRDLTSWFAEDQPQFIAVHYARWPYESIAKSSPDYTHVPVNFGPVVYLLERKSTSPTAQAPTLHSQAPHTHHAGNETERGAGNNALKHPLE